jgi:hypothetical protein
VRRRAGLSKARGWRWQQRFLTEGVDGLPRDQEEVGAEERPG